MTINPANFSPQGKPSIEQVEAVWNSHPKPSARKVADLLVSRGFDVSYRTVARFAAQRFLHVDRTKGRPTAEARQLRAATDTPEAVAHRAKRARQQMEYQRESRETAIPAPMLRALGDELDADDTTPQPVPPATPENPAGPPPTEEQIERQTIKQRIVELSTMTEADLRASEAKARVIFNIVLMESSARRADIMRLIPKDVAPLVGAMAEAAGAQRAVPVEPGDQMPQGRPGDDAKVIEHTKNPVSNAIALFKQKQAAG